ncbi:MAG: class A beta-lactamase-related serine hydrolase [Mojavia pulchra JT2-VF2]|uniref:Class A beta-lactamase-related serine hydrolase n=1 Tax=Mojavia pulchra JT2-VF2 TaxID=287848 RepID=A0A951UFC4_9NOST|nr:class A beta-lactamase-related serine hydrolase [Mojavia pulchra JT2-VF2]
MGQESAGKKSSGSQGVPVSESSDKLRAFSRRQPVNGRQRSKVQKVEQKKTKVPNQRRAVPGEAALTRPTNSISPSSMNAGAPKTRPGLVMPAVVKAIPRPNANAKAPPVPPSAMKLKPARVNKHASPRIGRKSRKTRLKPMARTLLYTLRLLIVGVGIGAIMGTVLSVLDPATRITPVASTQSNTNTNVGQSQPQPTPNTPSASGFYLSQEIIPLKTAVQNLAAANPNLSPGIFLVDLDTGGYVDLNSSASFPAASTIKVPILVAFFQDVDAGKIRLDEMLTMQQEMIAGGSGNMQYKPAGTQYTALEVAKKMITISDNTATNMLIARLGGMESLNQRFRTWGLTTTVIRNQLPDLQGTNTTSPRELGNLLGMVNQGNLVNMQSRDRLLDIMRQTERDHLLPSGLGAGATIAHKTGDIGTMLADAGLVDIPTGKRYIAAVMVQRPNNDPRAEKLISAISRAAYQQFSQTGVIPSNTTTTIPPTNYQPPVITSPVPNGAGTTVPMNGYQSPFIAPFPNGVGNTMPNTGYPSPPVMNPQYYPPR